MAQEVDFSILVHSPLAVPAAGPGASEAASVNRLSNPGFETAGEGGADVFASWAEQTDSGNATITRGSTTPDPHGGSYYCEIYSVAGGDVEGNVNQDVAVIPGERYRLTVWGRISGIYASMQPRWGVWDNTNSKWIVPREGTSLFSSLEWQQASLYFTVPTGCVSLKVVLYMNINIDSTVYFDDVSLNLLGQGQPSLLADYTNLITSYSHSLSVNVGYDTMSMGIAGDMSFLGEWLENGLGRHIVVVEASSGIVWEGFVNTVTLQAGGFQMSVGPLKNVINRGRIAYNLLDWAVTPAIGGDTVIAQWADELVSQGRYGILEGVISGGEGTSEEMLELLNTLMFEIAWPEGESTYTIASGGDFNATIECLGYGHLLDKYYITNIVGGEIDASEKIVTILNRNPNNIFLYGPGATIVNNTIQVPAYEDGTKTAFAILKEIANLGDTDDARYIFGVYNDRTVEYGPVPTTYRFMASVSDGRVELATGGFANPWEVRPGNWIKINDIAIGRVTDFVRPSEDPSRVFIEKVAYTAPFSLSITSGRATTFRQKLDRLGLGGM